LPNEPFPAPITPATIAVRDGALYSDRFDDIYHSVAGGIEEARHVFIGGSKLPNRWEEGGRFTIVETGFGCGLNFLATWNELNQSNCNVRLDYVSVEKHPFSREDLAQALQAWPQFGALSRKLLEVYPPLAPGFHRLHPGRGVTLTLLFGDALEQLRELDAYADAFFLDGFAPSRNASMWSDELFGEIGRLAASGATAATYSVAAKVKHGLTEAGFVVEKRAGFAHKREMLTARFSGTGLAMSATRNVVVIGAGIAGTSCARSLTQHGIEVDLLERAPHAGAETSSNPVALVRPFVTLDYGVRSRFVWSAFSYAVRCYRELNNQEGFCWHGSGVLHLARDQLHLDRLAQAVGRYALPDDLIRLVDSLEGTRLSGAQTQETGIWFPSAGYVNGRISCDAQIVAGASLVRFLPGVEAARIERSGGHWKILDSSNDLLAQGDSVILANGCHAQALIPDHNLRLSPVRGQVTAIPATSRDLRSPVCRDGYVTPVLNDMHFAGGTFDESMADAIVIDDDHFRNVSRAAQILPSVFGNISPELRSGWAGVRCVSRDRAPAVGAVLEDVYASLGMGSRGFTWAPLAGELLASALAGASCPLERSIANWISPRRLLAGAI
jgi:tRNA 5-methylaminomethyl-2-thiouridine biosynthesis bifunctional protein